MTTELGLGNTRIVGPFRYAFFSLLVLLGCKAPVTERAMSLARQNREDDAVHLLKAELAEHPKNVEARRLLIRVLAASGKLGQAREEVGRLEKEVGGEGHNPLPWIELGHAFELSHQYEEALEAYDTAARVAPESPLGPREGGLRLARWGEAEDARLRLEEATRRGANDSETWHTLGLVCAHLSDWAAAEKAYRAGVRAHPKSLANWIGIATVGVKERAFPKALEGYDHVLAIQPRHAGALLGRAWVLGEQGETARALESLKQAEDAGAPSEFVRNQRARLAGSH